jgi:hypothetical protein
LTPTIATHGPGGLSFSLSMGPIGTALKPDAPTLLI